MNVTYIKVIRDDEGSLVHTEPATAEVRRLQQLNQSLQAALEAEMQALKDLRELLDNTRRIALAEFDRAMGRGKA